MVETRSSERTIVFKQPFFLRGLGKEQPAGTYIVETDEEQLLEVSFPVFRRVATRIYLHDIPGDNRITGIATIDPEELNEALLRDSQQYMPPDP